MDINNIVSTKPIYSNTKNKISNISTSSISPIIDKVEISLEAEKQVKIATFLKDNSYIDSIYRGIKRTYGEEKSTEFAEFAIKTYEEYANKPISQDRQVKIDEFLKIRPYTHFSYNMIKDSCPNEANVWIEYYMENYGKTIYLNEIEEYPEDPHLVDSLLYSRGIKTLEAFEKEMRTSFFKKELLDINNYLHSQNIFIDEMIEKNIFWSSGDYDATKDYTQFYRNASIPYDDIKFNTDTGQIMILPKNSEQWITYEEFETLSKYNYFTTVPHMDLAEKYGDNGIIKYIENYIKNLNNEEKEYINEFDYFALPAYKNYNIKGLDEFIKPLNEIKRIREAEPWKNYYYRYYELRTDEMREEYIYPLYKASYMENENNNRDIIYFTSNHFTVGHDLSMYSVKKYIEELNGGKPSFIELDEKNHKKESIDKSMGTPLEYEREEDWHEKKMRSVIFQEIDGELYRMGTKEQKEYLDSRNTKKNVERNLTIEEMEEEIRKVIENAQNRKVTDFYNWSYKRDKSL